MSDYLRFLLAVFTVYRLARLVAIDDGPSFIFKRLRLWFKDKAYYEAGGTIKALEDDRNFGKWKNLSEGISCPFCIGIYASALVFPMLIWPSYWGDMFLLLVSLSGAQAFLQTQDRSQ